MSAAIFSYCHRYAQPTMLVFGGWLLFALTVACPAYGSGGGGHGAAPAKAHTESKKEAKKESHGGGHEGDHEAAPVAAETGVGMATSTPGIYAYKLGDFRILNYRPVEHEKVTIMFTLWVEVKEADKKNYEHVWESSEHRIRNQVITSARLIPPADFDDPKLNALRRRIYLRLRRAIPELPIEQVYVSDFSYLVD